MSRTAGSRVSQTAACAAANRGSVARAVSGSGRLSWLLNNRRLVRRYDRKAEHFQAFTDLGCVLLCYHRWTKATT